MKLFYFTNIINNYNINENIKKNKKKKKNIK